MTSKRALQTFWRIFRSPRTIFLASRKKIAPSLSSPIKRSGYGPEWEDRHFIFASKLRLWNKMRNRLNFQDCVQHSQFVAFVIDSLKCKILDTHENTQPTKCWKEKTPLADGYEPWQKKLTEKGVKNLLGLPDARGFVFTTSCSIIGSFFFFFFCALGKATERDRRGRCNNSEWNARGNVFRYREKIRPELSTFFALVNVPAFSQHCHRHRES